MLNESFARGICLGTGIAGLVHSIEFDQAAVPMCTAGVRGQGSLGWKGLLALVTDPCFALEGLSAWQAASCIDKPGLERFKPHMFLSRGLPEAETPFGSLLETAIPTGIQSHMRDPCYRVSRIDGRSWNLIKLQKPGK